MKTLRLIFALFIFGSLGASAKPLIVTDSLGLPGDNLDLYGVLDLFKKSENPEAFEKALNSPDSKLNNLDLNNDQQIDYIHVIDRTDKKSHALVLQVAINETEMQDVAVIEIEKKSDGTADVQIIGDEALYGKDYIIEPIDEAAAKAPENNETHTTTNVYVNVWGWPSVQYIYGPEYIVYVSPWGWHHYPGWWSPWRPVYWGYYDPYWHPYHYHHHRVYTHRVMDAHNVYYGHRRTSNTVIQRRNPNPTRMDAPVSRPLGKEAPRTIKEDRKPPRVIREKPRSAPNNNDRPIRQTPPRQKQQAQPRQQQAPRQKQQSGGRRK